MPRPKKSQPIKQKRHRRTKAEMEMARKLETSKQNQKDNAKKIKAVVNPILEGDDIGPVEKREKIPLRKPRKKKNKEVREQLISAVPIPPSENMTDAPVEEFDKQSFRKLIYDDKHRLVGIAFRTGKYCLILDVPGGILRSCMWNKELASGQSSNLTGLMNDNKIKDLPSRFHVLDATFNNLRDLADIISGLQY